MVNETPSKFIKYFSINRSFPPNNRKDKPRSQLIHKPRRIKPGRSLQPKQPQKFQSKSIQPSPFKKIRRARYLRARKWLIQSTKRSIELGKIRLVEKSIGGKEEIPSRQKIIFYWVYCQKVANARTGVL